MSVKFDVARCPVCSGKLEPAYEYGHTILRCQYCGYYAYVTITEGGKISFVKRVPIVTPKWTVHARQSLKITQNELKQAFGYVKQKDYEEANRRLAFIKDTIAHIPEEARNLPIINKIGKSISQAQRFFIDDETPKRFANEIKNLYITYIKTAPKVGKK